MLSIANAVLLSPAACAWKITDFGLTFEGTSRIKYTTRNSRGTQGYRAIELLRLGELGFVTKASDIWALGCIFYELAYQTKAFSDDIEVWDYVYRTQKLKQARQLEVNERTAAAMRELICRTLEVDWWKRPTAKDILQLLDSLTANPDIPAWVFYIGQQNSETGRNHTSNLLEPLNGSLPFSPTPTVAFQKEQKIALLLRSTPQYNSLPQSSISNSVPSVGSQSTFNTSVSETPHLIKLESDDARWRKTDWRSCW